MQNAFSSEDDQLFSLEYKLQPSLMADQLAEACNRKLSRH
jgi:hypothetical protein